jgi:hypothetical protein
MPGGVSSGALKRLGLSQAGAAHMVGRSSRQGQRWCDPKGKGPLKLIEQNLALDEELLRLRGHVRVLEWRDRERLGETEEARQAASRTRLPQAQKW